MKEKSTAENIVNETEIKSEEKLIKEFQKFMLNRKEKISSFPYITIAEFCIRKENSRPSRSDEASLIWRKKK